MTLTQARKLAASARLSDSDKVVLLCSYEPVALRTYLQAQLAQRHPEKTPEVVTLGFGNVREGLQAANSDLSAFPVLLFLNWEDLHPGLSWRTSRKFSPSVIDEIDETASDLEATVSRWITAREKASTYLVTSPRNWLPLLNPAHPNTISLTEARAIEMMDRCIFALVRGGARWIRFEARDLNLQEALDSGCPLDRNDSAALAELFIEITNP